ncbi:MAG: N-acetylmuramoyl-L-alanine amidase, partial [Hyphomicrobiaceae bacterium]
MSDFASDIQSQIDHAIAEEDIPALEGLLEQLYKKTPAEAAPAPFAADLELKPSVARKVQDPELEAAVGLGWANQISRGIRRVRYNQKIADPNFQGLRIVSEGDSWFQYPLLLEDIIDVLSKRPDLAVLSLGGAGHLVEEMVEQSEFSAALSDSGADIFLFSGGGNDLLGAGRLERVLLDYQDGTPAERLIDDASFDDILTRVVTHYRTVVEEVATRHSGVTVIGHGYDLPFPLEDGRWLGKPLAEKNIPLGVGRLLVRILMDRFNVALTRLSEEFPNFAYLDVRGTVKDNERSWHDELHPKNTGYGELAEKFRLAIERVASGALREAVTASPAKSGVAPTAAPANQEFIFEGNTGMATIVLDPGHGGTPPPIKIGGSSWNNARGPNGLLEKTVTLDVAKRARDVLENRGHDVHMTRTSDRNLSLSNRARVAKNLAAPVFVSIHFNGFDGDVQGTETWVHSTHRSQSATLCRALQAAVVAATGYKDRNAVEADGLKKKPLGVLTRSRHAANTAAVLLEVSFMDVAADEQRLRSATYKDEIADAIADGIENYLRSSGELEAVTLESMAEDELEDGFEIAAQEGISDGGHEAVHAAEGAGAAGLSYHTIARALTNYEGIGGQAQDDAENDVGEDDSINASEALDFSNFGRNPDDDARTLETMMQGLDEEAAAGFDHAGFAAFINGLGLQYFQPAEFLQLGASN